MNTRQQLNRMFKCALFVLAGACQPADEPAADQALSKTQLIYKLDLDQTGVEVSSEGLTLTTNLGYEVHISTLYVSSYSAELLECEPAQTSLIARLRAVELISSAWAGHAEEAAAASTTRGILEAWHQPAHSVELDVREVTRLDYCKLHYLVARNDDRFELLDPGLARLSVKVEGSWRLDETQAFQSFSVESAINNGKILTIAQDAAGAPRAFNAATLELHITRKLATAFDALAFSEVADDDLARQLLKNIIEGTTVTIVQP